MNFIEAVQSGFSNYVNFQGRSVRSEYWYWVLFVIICMIVAQLIDRTAIGFMVVYPIFVLAIALPGLAVSVRRLHDLDRSGWFVLLPLIPLIGAIILIYWHCQPGTAGDNRFGPDPLGASPQLAARRAF